MAGVRSPKLLSVTFTDPTVVNVTVHSSSKNPVPVKVAVYESGTNKIVASQNSKSDIPFQFSVPSAKLWSPDAPTLYNLTVTMGSDKVKSYTGFRTISKGTVDGVVRPLLNGEFIFMFGTLDQGFWPDGIYTPPTREAMVYDLQMLKNLGFNMLRKHVNCTPYF
jgi:beta-galactosidase/beta-glucuronidase